MTCFTIDNDDFTVFNSPGLPGPTVYKHKATWNGRSVQLLQTQSYCFVQKGLAIPETNSYQMVECEFELLVIDEEDVEEFDFFEEEEPEWEIANPIYLHTPNSDENATVEEILTRSGWGFDNHQQTASTSCKSLKHHAKNVKKGIKKTGKKCARFVVKHKKEILIGAAVVAVAVGVGVIIATAGAGAAASAGAAAGASRVPSRRKEEDETPSLAASGPTPGKERDPSLAAFPDNPGFQVDHRAAAFPQNLVQLNATNYESIHGLSSSNYESINGLASSYVNQAPVTHGMTPSKSRSFNDDSLSSALDPTKTYELAFTSLPSQGSNNVSVPKDRMFPENAREKILFPNPGIINSQPKMDGQPHISTPLHEVLFVPRSEIGLIPVTGLSPGDKTDWVVMNMDWAKIHFTTEELITGMVCLDDHFREFMPKNGSECSIFSAQNGINVSRKEFLAMGQDIHAKLPENPLIIGLYNPSEGLFKDVPRAIQEINGKPTPITETTRQFMAVIVKRGEEVNKEFHWVHIVHSEAGVIERRAVEGMTNTQKEALEKHLHIIALGPALPISKLEAFEAINIYSNQDFVTKGFALKYLDDPNYDIKIVPCISSWKERSFYIVDHARDGTTYDKSLDDALYKTRLNQGVYEGNAR